MPQSVPLSNSGSIALVVIPQPNGRYLCEVTLSIQGQTEPTRQFCGQNPKHAIAIALENLARTFRREAEAEQKVAWEALEKRPSGTVTAKHFHVILHYERVAEEESKFDAMLNTHMGNTVVENAEVTIIQVDSDLPLEPLQR